LTNKRLISAFVSGVILLQLHVLVLFLPRDRFPSLHRIAPPRLWPFVDYPMFSQQRQEGDIIPNYRVFGIFDDLAEVQIGPDELGIGYWHFTAFVYALREDRNSETLRAFINLYETRANRKLSSLRLENHPWIFLPEGLNPGRVEVVATVKIDDSKRSAP
jgi:hypothetical protein